MSEIVDLESGKESLLAQGSTEEIIAIGYLYSLENSRLPEEEGKIKIAVQELISFGKRRETIELLVVKIHL